MHVLKADNDGAFPLNEDNQPLQFKFSYELGPLTALQHRALSEVTIELLYTKLYCIITNVHRYLNCTYSFEIKREAVGASVHFM